MMAPTLSPCCRYWGVRRVWTDYPDDLVADLDCAVPNRNHWLGRWRGDHPRRRRTSPGQGDVDDLGQFGRRRSCRLSLARVADRQRELLTLECHHRAGLAIAEVVERDLANGDLRLAGDAAIELLAVEEGGRQGGVR